MRQNTQNVNKVGQTSWSAADLPVRLPQFPIPYPVLWRQPPPPPPSKIKPPPATNPSPLSSRKPGPPGAGKSTLVDQLASFIRQTGQTVGIIAIDPFTRGALLGDRIRMQRHHADPGVFIRSMASRGKLGGLTRGALEMALLLDAAGCDYVLVETVGVGQEEVDIARLADVTIAVLVPGMGDDVQAIKAGILEIADIFAINKSDLAGAEPLEQDLRAMQSVAHDVGATKAAPIRRVIATSGTGVDHLLAVIHDVYAVHGSQNRSASAWSFRLRELLRDELLESLPTDAIEEHAARLAE